MDYSSWIEKPATSTQRIDPWPANSLRKALDLGSRSELSEGDELPMLWHWCYFLEAPTRENTAADGHLAKGAFLPPIPLSRRMWARGRVQKHAPLRLGETASKTSTVKSVTEKSGRTGQLVFVVVEHQFFDHDGNLAITELHDIVYRKASEGAFRYVAEPETLASGNWQSQFSADPVLLFRYSALTFNGHRIHYDGDYVRKEEGYPGLIVHGPLIATLAAEFHHLYRPDADLQRFDFKMLSPVFDDDEMTFSGDGNNIYAHDSAGRRSMQAEITLA